ncbi:MAG: glucosaminidase domain-containing protein, partial [Gammaproteobacteria bacterium]
MDKQRRQELGAAAVVSAALTGLVLLVNALAGPGQQDADAIPAQEPIQVFPDFASIQDVEIKKQQFFDYLQDYIDARNAEVAQRREQLQAYAAAITDGGSLSRIELDRLQQLADMYRLDMENSTESAAEMIQTLLNRVDVIPTSLVLAQAANESAWGTSRFTLEGFNLFGQWCFEEGCGIVPRQRAAGAIHEVKRFESIQRAIDSYFLNINTHHSYRFFRDLRAQMRAQERQLNSVVLAFGLGRYSERGGNYIDEVQNIIIQNELTERDSVH